MIRKIIFSLILCLLILTPLFAQEIDYKTEYEDLLDSYESLLDDYEGVISELEETNNKYEAEIDKHELSKEQIQLDQTEITMLRDSLEDLIKLVDPKYFTLFLKGGYITTNPLGEIGISASLPKLPMSVYGGMEYVLNVGYSVKLGIGVKF